MPLASVHGALRERALAKLLPQNGLLATLSDGTRERLLPHLALADLPAGHQLGEPGGRFARVFFPLAGVVSLSRGTAERGERLLALVGHEGAVGLPRFMNEAAGARAVVQCAGYGLALGRDQLLEEWARGGSFMRLLMRYSRAMTAQMAVLGTCRAAHSAQQRLCSLLLMGLERLPGQEAQLDQDAAVRITGAAPEQVSAAIDGLCAAGIAAWRRPGLFAVHDRSALRALACGCERRVADEYAHLLAPESQAAAASATASAAAASEISPRRQRREMFAARSGAERPNSV
jgi:CRP-like cAMP-binding protein